MILDYLIYFVVYFVYGIIFVLQALMLVRAITSWFVQDEGSRFYNFLYYATEPAIYPVRWLLHKIGLAGDGMMIDVSFLVTVILLSMVQMLLPTVTL